MSSAPPRILPTPIRGLLLWLGLPALALAAARLLDPRLGWLPLPWPWALPGLVAALAGLGLARWAQLQRGMLGPLPDPRREEGAGGGLHPDGAYHLCRHPEYLGLGLYLLGWSALLRSPSALLLALVLCGAWTLYGVVREEPRLVERYGGEAARWRNSTPLLPRPGRWREAVRHPAPPPLYLYTRAFSRSILRLWSGLEGPDARRVPRHGGLVVAANHRSYLDAFLLAAAYPRPIAFLSTSEAFRPLWQRLFLNGLGCIRLRRFAPDPHAIRGVLRAVRTGAAVGIFPEGERSWDGGPAPLLPGVARLLELTRVPVHPVRLKGSYRLWPRWGRGPRRAPVRVAWGDPLPTAPARDLELALIDALSTRPDPPTSRKRSAADVGRLLWRCPSCAHPDAIRGRRDGRVWCIRCGGQGRLHDGTHLDWAESGPRTLREWAREVALTGSERHALAAGPDPPRHWPFLRLSDGEGDLPLRARGKGEAVLTPEVLVLRARGWRACLPADAIRSVTVEGSHKLQVATRRRIYELRYRRGSPRGPRIHLEAWLDARGVSYRRG